MNDADRLHEAVRDAGGRQLLADSREHFTGRRARPWRRRRWERKFLLALELGLLGVEHVHGDHRPWLVVRERERERER